MILFSSVRVGITIPTRPDGAQDVGSLMTLITEHLNHLTKRLPGDVRDVGWFITKNGGFLDLKLTWRSTE